MKNVPLIIGIIGVGCIVTIIVTINISIWNECRVDHSILYCLQLVGK